MRTPRSPIRVGLRIDFPSRSEGYVIATAEGANLARLIEKYGIEGGLVNSVHLVNSEEDMQPSSGKLEPLIT
jgi:hypothetical protein